MGKLMKRILIIIILLFLSGCITDKNFWHKDNRVRIKPPADKIDYESSQKLRRLRVIALEQMHAESSDPNNHVKR